ncbi:hypothetical protein ACFZ8E_06250 [Methylobacterium sp. HMF5984]|uniref:hypothetical protein n=1 Tax=Methylobacterium sp. HMF5984 TaxID=3367370 RepID=UPI0038549E49
MARKRRLKAIDRRKRAAAGTSKVFEAIGTSKHSWAAERRQRWNSGSHGPASPCRVLVRDGQPTGAAHG